jgi:hypothetical protein
MRLVLVLLAVGVTIYALVDCARSGADEVRGLPKPLWLVVILLLFPPVGGLLYITLGRATGTAGTMQGRPRVVAPDDDPEFLRTLERRAPGPGTPSEGRRSGDRRPDQPKADGTRPDGSRPDGTRTDGPRGEPLPDGPLAEGPREDQDGDDHSDRRAG